MAYIALLVFRLREVVMNQESPNNNRNDYEAGAKTGKCVSCCLTHNPQNDIYVYRNAGQKEQPVADHNLLFPLADFDTAREHQTKHDSRKKIKQ